MLKRALIWIAWIGILFTAIFLRVNDLGERPIHADEATGARILAQRLEDDSYRFDPTHFHGPLQSVLSSPITQLRGEKTWESLSEETLRIGPVIAGMLMIFTPLLWVRSIGIGSATLAAAFLATSPLLVYYNRMFIHESWLALFGMISAPAVYYLIENPKARTSAFAGIFIGLMFATKETFAISIMSWGLAGFVLVATRLRETQSSLLLQIKQFSLPIAIGIGTSLFVGAIFYTHYFTQPSGLIDAIKTYFVYETTPGHDKPFTYYFNFLILPKQEIGKWWSEGFIAIFLIISTIYALRNWKSERAIIFLIVSLLGHFIIYSIIQYKTPWLMLLPWALAAILAGCCIKFTKEKALFIKIGVGVLVVIALGFQIQQSVRATGRLANDIRNPYAYVPTSKDPLRIQKWIQQLAPLDTEALSPSAVVGSGYWPLPWYLRDIETVGYWTAPIDEMRDFPLVFALAEQVDGSDGILGVSHTKLPRGLRANVPVVMYLRNDIWTRWIEDSDL